MSDFSQNLADALNALKQQETGVANAIRSKKGYPSTQKINPQNFPQEIASIPTGGGSGLQNYYVAARHQYDTINIAFYASSSASAQVHYDYSNGEVLVDGDVLDIDLYNYHENHKLAYCFYIYLTGFTSLDDEYELRIGDITLENDSDLLLAGRLNVIYYDDYLYVYIWR